MRYTLSVLFLLALSLSFVSAATVTGQVIGTDGKPIKGASIYLYLFDERKSLELLTDTEGNFSVEADLAGRGTNSYVGSIVAYASGNALACAMLQKSGCVITLSAGTTISGVVADAGGKPLAGVPVRLSLLEINNGPYGRIGVPDAWRTRFTASTAADGAWTLPGIPLEGKATLFLDDDRYVHEQQTITLAAGENAATVRFTARPGATLTGRVLTPEGTPAADTRVWASPDPPNNSAATSGSAKTATDGSYHIAGLSSGTYTINAYSEKQEWIAEPLKAITLTEGKKTAAQDLRAHTGAALEGTVVDAETGTPIPYASIMLYKGKKISDDSALSFLNTDKSGHFLLRTRPTQVTLCIQNPSHGT